MGRRFFYLAISILVISEGLTGAWAGTVRSPEHWSGHHFRGNLQTYEQLERWHKPIGEDDHGSGTGGVIANFLGARATRAGLEALRVGGSAMDAALTVALTETALTVGRYISFAGKASALYYDAQSGKVFHIDGTYQLPKKLLSGEKVADATIETGGLGRTVMVPAFMKFVDLAHEKFGKLEYSELFTPALFFAEKGIVVDASLDRIFKSEKEKILRHPEGRALFLKDPSNSSSLYKLGDLFKQKALARTLRRFQREGNSNFMYEGEWGRQLVEMVHRPGEEGVLEQSDLKGYQAQLETPFFTTYRGRTIHSTPSSGGAYVLEVLNTIEAARNSLGSFMEPASDHLKSAEHLYYLAQMFHVSAVSPLTNYFFRATNKEHAAKLWDQIKIGAPFAAPQKGSHTSSVIVVDPQGNIAVIVFTINTLYWGRNGFFVGGISIPDSAGNYAYLLDHKVVAPGDRVPNGLSPVLVLNQGRPELAAGAIGAGLGFVMPQALSHILDYGMNPHEALKRPMYHFGGFRKSELSPSLLGDLEDWEVPTSDKPAPGFWMGVRLDEQGKMDGAVSREIGIPSFIEFFDSL